MRADTWGEVFFAAAQFGSALTSRVHNLLPSEQARRRADDAKLLDSLKAAIATARAHGDTPTWAEPDDDTLHVEAWMAENGFTQHSDSWGVSEQTEAAITAATEAFRQRLADILGHDDFDFNVHVGLDIAEDTE